MYRDWICLLSSSLKPAIGLLSPDWTSTDGALSRICCTEVPRLDIGYVKPSRRFPSEASWLLMASGSVVAHFTNLMASALWCDLLTTTYGFDMLPNWPDGCAPSVGMVNTPRSSLFLAASAAGTKNEPMMYIADLPFRNAVCPSAYVSPRALFSRYPLSIQFL